MELYASDEFFEDDGIDENDPQTLLQYGEKKQCFIDCILQCSVEIDYASKFQNDVMKLLNSRKGQVDRMYVWTIASHCETSHKVMKMV